MDNPSPADESGRLAAVRRYDILDTPADGAFDRVTAIAARAFNVPIAIVSLVDRDRIWFKSHHGLDASEIGRDPGLCASAIMREGPHVLTDAKADPVALANPLVAGQFGLRFYAGIPLRTHDGFNLGTLCVIDKAPREASADEIALLEDLAAIVMDQMELRLAARAAVADAAALAGEIAESGQNFRFLADSMAQKIFTASPDGGVDYLNPVWADFTGLSIEAIRNWGWTQFIHPDDVEENVRLWKHCVETGQPFQFEHRFRAADGAWRWHISRATPMRDSAGKIHRWIGSNTDIHEQKLREEAARKAASHAELMAHEIDHRVMNSLQFISGLLATQARLARSDEAAEELRIAASRVAAISRVHRHFYQETAPESVPCLAFLTRLGADLSEVLGVDIVVEGSEAAIATARILAIGLLLNEFVANAAKHGAGRIEVSFEAGADGDRVLSVADQGPGLPADFKPENPGHGLGMKVILALTKQLNGKLSAGSGPMGGARFTVAFPA